MAYQSEKVNKQLLVPQIEDQLMLYINRGDRAVGSRHPSGYELAELFGVGRSMVREAVNLLEPEVAATACMKNEAADMAMGSIAPQIFGFTVPVLLGLIFQRMP